MKKSKLLTLSLGALLVLAGCTSTPATSGTSSEKSEDSVVTTPSSDEKDVPSSSDEVTTYSITNGNEEGVTLTGIPTSIKEGDSITFGYKTNSGYVLNGEIKVLTSSNEEIAVTNNNDGTYTFLMPASNVTITLGTSHKLYKITKDEETKSLINTIKCEFSLEYVTGEDAISSQYEDIWSHDNKAEYTKNVIVSLRSSNTLKPTGIIIPEMDNLTLTLADGQDSVSFVMPNKDITIKVTSAANTHTVAFVNSEHISLSLFEKSEETYTQTSEVVSSSTYYLKATSSDESYKIKEINYTYTPTFGDDTTVKLTELVDGYYKVELPILKDGTGVTFNVTEAQGGVYANYSFVGSYIGTTISKNESAEVSWGTIYKTTIEDTGLFSINGDDYSITSVGGLNRGEAIATRTDGTTFKFFYDGKHIIADSSFSNHEDYLTTTTYLGIKAPEGTPTYVRDAYLGFADRVDYLTVFEFRKTAEANNYSYADSTLLETIAFDTQKKLLYTEDVSISITEGTAAFYRENVSYNVLVNGNVAYRLKSTGKYSPKRTILDEAYGEYKLADASQTTLVLDGEGGATYNGQNGYKYVLEGGKVTLTGNGKEIVITIDIANKTYVVVSEKTISNPLVGSTFTDAGKVSYTYYEDEDDFWGTTYDCTITLFFKDATTCTLSWVDDGSDTIIPEADYPYEVSGKNVTIHATTSSNQKADVKLLLSDDGTELKFTADVSYEEVTGLHLTKQ